MKNMSAFVFVFLVICGFSSAMIRLETHCPNVAVDDTSDCPGECENGHDCGLNQWCCPNSCGTTTCTNVSMPCIQDGAMVPHHHIMNFVEKNVDANKCGFCWCQNGKRACYQHACDGSEPIP